MSEKKSNNNIVMIFHQLKRPLYTLREIFSLLDKEEYGSLNEKQKDYIRDSKEEIDVMIDIMGTLFEAIKIEENEYKVSEDKVDLVQITEEVIKGLFAFAKASRTNIIFEKKEDIPSVKTDEIKIKFVIDTLISNAISYKDQSKEGEVNIEIKEDGDYVLFSIKDNGIGLLEEEKEDIFKKFNRGREASRIAPNGQGLGLFISKAIIDLSGGEIWAERREEGGSIFYFKLPKI